MGLNRKLIRWIRNFLYQRKLIISINDQLSDPITPIHDVPQGSPLSPILFILYVSDIPQPLDPRVNLSQFAGDIAIWVHAPGIRSINLRLQKYLNQILTWRDRWRIKLNPRKTHLINFSQRKVIKDTSISMYGQPLKVTESFEFWDVHIDNHLSMKQHMEDIERASLISRMKITKLNSINAALLIRLYKTFRRPYMDYACTALTVLNQTQRQKLEVFQNRCLRYARRVFGSTCISNSELRSRCNIVSVEQCILAIADSW